MVKTWTIVLANTHVDLNTEAISRKKTHESVKRTTSTLQNPLHTYVDTGYMIVTLITAYNGCKDTLVIPDFVYINPPIANFKVIVDCSDRKKRRFLSNGLSFGKL